MTKEQINGNIISERWSYHSIFGTGSDYGTRACVYLPSKNLAILVTTRDRMVGAQNTGWEPLDKGDHFYDEQKVDIMSKKIIKCSESLDEQIKIFKEERQSNYEEDTNKREAYSYSYLRTNDISLSQQEVELLNQRKDIELFNWLSKNLSQGAEIN